MEQERVGVDSVSHLDIRWRLISGKVTSPESRMLLSQALAIFHVSGFADLIIGTVTQRMNCIAHGYFSFR